jgi:hypothetical protein
MLERFDTDETKLSYVPLWLTDISHLVFYFALQLKVLQLLCRSLVYDFILSKPVHSFIHSFIPLACAEYDDSLPFSGASSIPFCYVLFPTTLFHQLSFHPRSIHLAIYFMNYLSILFPNSYIILFWEFCFLPFSVHVQTIVIYLTLFSLLLDDIK